MTPRVADMTYGPDVFCPIVHDFVTMWPPMTEDENYSRYLRNRKAINDAAKTKAKARKG